jgi:hypothetical protein
MKDSVLHQTAEFGVSLLRGDGHDWRRQRRVVEPSACGSVRACSRGAATAQSLGLSMFGNLVLTCWFASTLRASWHIRHTADASPYMRDYALCPKWVSSANGGLSCRVKVRRLQAGYVQYERATARFNRLIGVCSAKRVRSK